VRGREELVKPRAAVVAVCAVMAAAAVVSYAVGDPASRLTGTVRLARPLGDSIPHELAGWRGVDDPMSDEAVRTTRVDDYVRRRYRSQDGAEVLLYVAYHGNKERGMQTYYHNATVCFPSQGWNLESEKNGTETLHDAAKEVPVCRYVFAKDGLRLSVMTFFKVDRDLLDQSPRNKPFWMLLDRATPQLDDSPGTFVQVQLLTTVGASGENGAADRQSRFLRDFGRTILSAVEAGSPE
jgi:EpsI family protein